MLVLSRKLDEEIQIGPDITIMVVEIRGNKVRLALSAPSDTVILRKELYDENSRKNSRSSSDTN